MTQLMHEPLAETEGLVLVCGERWTTRGLRQLEQLAAFYGVRVCVLALPGMATATAALTAVLAASRAERILLLAPGRLAASDGAGSCARPSKHFRLQPLCCASLTVLHEDNSIAYAGVSGIEALGTAPYVRVRRFMAGMPAAMIEGGEGGRSRAASVDCCLFTRAALEALSGPNPIAATRRGEETGLFIQLREAGVAMHWLPVRMSSRLRMRHELPTSRPLANWWTAGACAPA